MRLIRNFDIPEHAKNCVVAIGNFDGLHKGHLAVIEYAKEIAKKNNKKIGIITFEPHPKNFFSRSFDYFRLTPFRTKFELTSKLMIDYYFNIRFDKNFAGISAENFVIQILIKSLRVCHIVTGEDFVFGNMKRGNVKMLKRISEEKNTFNFSTVNEMGNTNSEKISSSIVRKKILEGDIKDIKEYLNRDWSIKSRVIKGLQKGKQLGFPTANFYTRKFCKMMYGVYAVKVKIFYKKSCKLLDGIANYGTRPTFSGKAPLLEVNIFDFNDLIYGQLVEICFKSFIRNEKKFKNEIELKNQINTDIKIAKRLLNYD